MEQDLITVPEAAKMLGVSKRTIARLIESGELPAFKRLGIKSLLVPRSKVEEYLTPRPVPIKAPAKSGRKNK